MAYRVSDGYRQGNGTELRVTWENKQQWIMYTQIHNLVYDYHLLILAILTTQAAIPNGRYEPKVPEWASLSYHNVYTEDFLNRKIWETIDWERILMAHFGLLSRYLARKRSGYWWKGCSPLPLKRGAISLHPIQKQWRHYMTSSLQNNVNEIRCNHDAYDDVVPHYPIVTARLLLPYCGW